MQTAEQRPTNTLTPHPVNAAIYDDGPDAELLDSIRQQGILTPLSITAAGIIISGHRRWLAAKELRLPTVPVIVSPLTDDLDVREAVIEANRQRAKTTEQRAREYTEIKAIEAERAKQRQLGTLKQGADAPVPKKFTEREKGDSRDIAAKKVGMSGPTAEKAATVVKAVDTLKEQGKPKEAEELRRALNTKPVSAAYRKASGMGLVPKPEKNGHTPEPIQESILSASVAVHCADARQLGEIVAEPVHLVITSPPYNVGVEYGTHDDLMEPSAYRRLLGDVFRACHAVMAPGARLAVVVPAGVGRTNYWPLARMVSTELEFAELRMEGEIVWDKGQATVAGRTSWGSWRSPVSPRLRDRTERILIASKPGALSVPSLPDDWLPADLFTELTQDLWEVPPESAQRIGHPAPFPVELARRLIRLYAFPGAHVLDPFAGSGTVGVATVRLGANATLIDIDAGYCEMARKRCSSEL